MANSTICAISTPPGVGGIAVARVSGPDAIDIVGKIWRGKPLSLCPSHTAHLGMVTTLDGDDIDQAVATIYRAPRSFTADDVVEISVHGSRYVQSALIETLIQAGATLAQPGEFTRRAFAAGKMDLSQAEAVADIIASESKAAHRIAMTQMRGRYSERLRQLREQLITLASLLELELDFSEEDVEFASRQHLLDIACQVKQEVDRLASSFHAGTAIKNGIPVAIIGATNAGKSSLLNSLLGDDRAIVSDTHGTTRDIVEDTIAIGDYTFRLKDTAGLRHTTDHIEQAGIERSYKAAAAAAIIVYVIDSEMPVPPSEQIAQILASTDAHIIVALNKADLNPSPSLPQVIASIKATPAATVSITANAPDGAQPVADALQHIASDTEAAQQSVLVTNARHYQALTQASAAITRAIDAIRANLSGDLIAIDTRLAIHHLGDILGDITSSDILQSIFSRFCIGK